MLTKIGFGIRWLRLFAESEEKMVREICKDESFLAQKSEVACEQDQNIAYDLLDTLLAHKERCVGMAANMIGECKRIIAFEEDGKYHIMLNPYIIKKGQPYYTEEACLSLNGIRKTLRYKTIKVQWQNEKMQSRIKSFSGWTAQIIQHEIDHCEGILI